MSDQLAAVAAALGAPEAIVKRSAEARAKAAGVSVEEILAAWAGGAAVPVAAPERQPEEAGRQPDGERQPEEAGRQPEEASRETADLGRETADVGRETAAAGGEVGVTVVAEPPVLVGRREKAGLLVAGVVGLLALALLLGVAAPSVPEPGTGVRSSRLSFSEAALAGRQIYLEQGCGSCHTQMIRNVVSDLGLGPVTLSDTNQVLGYRRYGPDLAAVGARITDPAAYRSILAGGQGHPPMSGLSEEELGNLIAYLLESR